MKNLEFNEMQKIRGGNTCDDFWNAAGNPLYWFSGLGIAYLFWASVNCSLCPECP